MFSCPKVPAGYSGPCLRQPMHSLVWTVQVPKMLQKPLDSYYRKTLLNQMIKKVQYHDHGDGEVGSELVVGPELGSPNTVLIDAASVDQLWLLLTCHWCTIHPEMLLKVLLNQAAPFLEWHCYFLSCKAKKTFWLIIVFCITMFTKCSGPCNKFVPLTFL